MGKSLEDVFGTVIDRQVQQGVIRRFDAPVRSPDPGGEEPGPDHRIALMQYGLDVANHVMAEYLL